MIADAGLEIRATMLVALSSPVSDMSRGSPFGGANESVHVDVGLGDFSPRLDCHGR